ncbi:hypothetical protein H4R21_005453 [Coemansia helicoidea]|uniref:Uncharacterized protein n=1 Tax=Coemansia helicoidea TaxID=1286919 RepID=A0ACC1KT25_9FUNG|nr:hypothetical protein H4R21_005453 [Coemansia helicoidea]
MLRGVARQTCAGLRRQRCRLASNGAGSSGRRDPPPRPAEAADAEATDGTGDGPACIGFDAGFRDGYRAGYDEGRRSIEAVRGAPKE